MKDADHGVVLLVTMSPADGVEASVRARGFATMTAASLAAAMEALDETAGGVDTIVVAGALAREGFIPTVRKAYALLPVVVLSDSRRVEDAIAAFREGATDYLLAPAPESELSESLARAVTKGQMARELSVRRALDPALVRPPDDLVASGETMQRVLQIVDRVKDSSVPVLVTGETGTGKEVLARALHRRSQRGHAPFVAINCASLPRELVESELFGHVRGAFTGADEDKPGRFQEAGAGTLFLDEIGELDTSIQAKLLRVLQESEVTPVGGTTIKTEARVVAATNRDLEDEVRQRRFRADLFYRLNVVTIRLPPLRQRREEIPELAVHLLERFAVSENLPMLTLSDGALQLLASLELPGNIRELENILKRSALLSTGRTIEASDIAIEDTPIPQAEAEAPSAPTMNLARHERAMMMRALAQARGNVSAAARALGIGRTTFYRRARRYKIAL